MSRCLLHKSKLEAFKSWLTDAGIAHRAGRGFWQVLQVKIRGQWHCIYDRLDAPEHYTVPLPLESLVRRFIAHAKLVEAAARRGISETPTPAPAPMSPSSDDDAGPMTASTLGLLNHDAPAPECPPMASGGGGDSGGAGATGSWEAPAPSYSSDNSYSSSSSDSGASSGWSSTD